MPSLHIRSETATQLRRTLVMIASVPKQPALVKGAKCEPHGHTVLASQIEVGAEGRSASHVVATHHLKKRGMQIRVC